MNKLVLGLGVLALSGCGLHVGFVRDSDTETHLGYSMNVSSIQYKRTASGSADIGSVFCLIPFGADPYKQASEQLLKNAALAENEILVNHREDRGLTGIPYLWCNFRYTISADVVRLTPAPPPPAPTVTVTNTAPPAPTMPTTTPSPAPVVAPPAVAAPSTTTPAAPAAATTPAPATPSETP
jgi:hypothetical protein